MSALRIFLVCLICALALNAQTKGAPESVAKKARRSRAARTPAEAQQVKRWIAAMPLAERIAQLIIVPFYGENPGARSKEYRKFASLVSRTRVGGFIVINRVQNGVTKPAEPVEMATFLNKMQRLAKVPLIVGGDFERGASMRVNGTAKFPHQMAFAAARDLNATRRLGAVTARESRALGVHWVFAPVADVSNNPENPIINIRAFSADPKEAASHVQAFIQGARSDPKHPVLLTVKHFPGHGDTTVDSHLGLGRLEASTDRLREIELPPFRAAISAGVDSVMTAHLYVPSLDREEIPATISRSVLTGLLRKELGFTGMIATDAMDMSGLRKNLTPGEAAIRAIEAGGDILLMPPNPEQVIRAVTAAVRNGRITARRIDESVTRLLEAKVRLGLQRTRLVNLENVKDELGWEEDEQLAAEVAGKALTVVRNENRRLPIQESGRSCWMILTESRFGQQGRAMGEFLSARAPTARWLLLDPALPESEFASTIASTGACDSIVVAAFTGFRGNGSLPEKQARFVDSLAGLGKHLLLVSLGNPYLLRHYPAFPVLLATFSTSPHSEVAAAKAVLGELAAQGRLPVTIPGIASYGDGIEVSASGNATRQ
jgi:beta-N-acetylhexosaminidase